MIVGVTQLAGNGWQNFSPAGLLTVRTPRVPS